MVGKVCYYVTKLRGVSMMTYQMIEGQKLWCVGFMLFKLPENPTQEMIALRRNQAIHFSEGNALIAEALWTMALEGKVKTYNHEFAVQLESSIEKFKKEIKFLKHS
ncbi:hypothetical protein D3C71_1695440 [compost metagenome]